MKTIIIVAIAAITAVLLWFMKTDKRVMNLKFHPKSLKGNTLGEKEERELWVYLPEGYDKGDQHYPVIYYLHGFTDNYNTFKTLEMKKLMDAAIKSGRIQACILVVPDSDTKFKGSFYANEWADYIAVDLVNYIDSSFRTIKDKSSRGIAGHSMGGNGAMKLAMLYPNVFGSVHAMSPSVLNWSTEFTLDNPSFAIIDKAKTQDDVFADFYASVLTAMGRTYAPDINSTHFQARFPVVFKDGKREIDSAILDQWNKQFPIQIFDKDSDCLKQVSGVLIDCGTEDGYPHIPITCKELSEKIKARGISCNYELYEGDHSSGLGGTEGRIGKNMLEFFNKNLKFK